MRLIEQDKGERYTALVPLFGLDDLEQAANNAHGLTQAIRSRSTIENDRREITALRQSAQVALGSTETQAVLARLAVIWSRYLAEPLPEDLATITERLASETSARVERAQPDQRLHVQLEGIKSQDYTSKISAAIDTRERANSLVDRLLDAKLPILQNAESFLRAIPADQAEINCPACGRDIDVDAMREHVLGELATLKEARMAREAAETAGTAFLTALRTVQQTLRDQQVRDWTATTEVRQAFDVVRDVDPQTFEGTDPDPLKRLQPEIARVEKCVAEKIRIVPPGVAQLLGDREAIASANGLLKAVDLET
ncbi:MAG: hypothetical protein ACREMY_32950, partial [bacterium]